MGGYFDLSDLQKQAEEVAEEPATVAPLDRYVAAMRALDSGVALKARIDPTETEPQGLRVGVNSSLLQQSALAHLLIKKGLITEDEFFDDLADAAEQEVAKYQQWISVTTGANVTLQ